MNALVVYYSRTGNAKFVAEKIAQELGADIEEVIDKKNRRGVIGFLTAGYDATRGKKTRIAETKKSPGKFDLVVVGTPTWNSRPAPAIRTYLSNNDLSGKRVAIFCTTVGFGGEKAIERTKILIPNSDFLRQLVVLNATKNKADTENRISEWCSRLR